jgi:hypothetical protein
VNFFLQLDVALLKLPDGLLQFTESFGIGRSTRIRGLNSERDQ